MDVGEIRSFIQAAMPELDAGTEPLPASRLFTPADHRDALRPETTLVIGGRGVGKTVWSKALEDSDSRRLAALVYGLPQLEGLKVHRGHGERAQRRSYPGPATMATLLRDGVTAQNIWRSVVLHALRGGGDIDWDAATRQLAADPVSYENELEDLAASEDTHVVVFDALDRSSSSRSVAQQLVDALLEVALEVRTRTSTIRLKVFLRPDLVNQLRFVDASKILANPAMLSWGTSSLYGALFTHLANADDEAGASKFRQYTAAAWDRVAGLGWRADRLGGDQAEQRTLFERLASPHMGSNYRRGYTYPWLPTHLADGRGTATPRSFLKAVSEAAAVTARERANMPVALHWHGIKSGVQAASSVRKNEVLEDMPWVSDVMDPLRGLPVPTLEVDLCARWNSKLLEGLADEGVADSETDQENVHMRPLASPDAEDLVAELLRLGLLTRRADDRLDMPDVYRVAFGLVRKGGVRAVG